MGSTMWVDALWDTVSQSAEIAVGPYRVTRKFSIGMTVKSSDRVPSNDLHDALRKALNRVMEEEVNLMLDEKSIREDLIKQIMVAKKMEAELPALEKEAERRLMEGTANGS